MVSKPAFDPNLFATGISAVELEQSDQRSAQAAAESRDSKPFFAGIRVQGLHGGCRSGSGTLNPLRDDLLPGLRDVLRAHVSPATNTKDTERLSLHDAIVNSCNVFFYNVGNELGIDRISQYATMMGLGRKTGIDLPNEDAGLIPSKDGSSEFYKAKWYAGETISVCDRTRLRWRHADAGGMGHGRPGDRRPPEAAASGQSAGT